MTPKTFAKLTLALGCTLAVACGGQSPVEFPDHEAAGDAAPEDGGGSSGSGSSSGSKGHASSSSSSSGGSGSSSGSSSGGGRGSSSGGGDGGGSSGALYCPQTDRYYEEFLEAVAGGAVTLCAKGVCAADECCFSESSENVCVEK
jgi:hypothetical protein